MRMRTFLIAVLFAGLLASCTDSPTATTSTELGQTTLEKFLENTAYRSWYETGYDAYPATPAEIAAFDSSVAVIRSSFDSTVHRVVMVVKPNCGCQNTQLWMPRVMRSLDAAGVPRSHVDIFVTDSRLAGIDSVKTAYNITEAPTFLVLRNDRIAGSILLAPPANRTVEQELADFFQKP